MIEIQDTKEQKFDKQELEITIANHCAPVLCGIKSSNMICVNRHEANSICKVCRETNLSTTCLFENCQKSVLLLYNRLMMEQTMNEFKNKEFLENQGYETLEVIDVLHEVSKRFTSYKQNEAEFPHELGILLGYPVWDVIGFIENKGENCLYTGYWKVYYELSKAIVTFHQYDNARKKVLNKIKQGNTLASILAGGM